MYCFEAHRCTLYDCPVQRHQIMRCWQYLEAKLKRPVTPEDCPYAPCEKCNYRLGWEIGLIDESMFPENPDPTPESLMPEPVDELPAAPETAPKDQPQTEPQALPPAFISTAPAAPTGDLQAKEPVKAAPDIEQALTQLEGIFATPDKIGPPGMRFCYELLDCPNPKCVVRVQQIIQCFNYFSRRSPEDKQRLTCGNRLCSQCFYKRGWDFGLLGEHLFADIIEKKKLTLSSIDRVKRNSLVEMYLSELSKKPLSRQEEFKLAQKIAGDREASELFLLANLKLVTRVAKKFSGGALPLMDLIQEGNIGLIKAIAKFDYTLGYRFSTYAAYWIRFYMQKAVAHQGSSITIPHHLLTVAHKIRRHIQEFENQFFRPPTITELSQTLGLEKDKILSVLSITQTPVSIHAKSGSEDDDGEAMEYYLEDKKNLTPEEAALEKLKNEAIRDGLARLPERLRYVIENFYGFNKEELSLAEIGRRLDISRERVRQLLHQALKQLQSEEAITWHEPS
ncbi:MAG TPA: sigma-70 family RNA polymerase sigma factor [Candidatus Rifleibacterium sp.]|nr:sigma-70 family RNA polymerase sigma factor [Candidatus Rifleibacterium sp.]HPT44553.1 sigma-70 family RNA polymerase sigma factor [Candidatus Rifleibacterium sp.]